MNREKTILCREAIACNGHYGNENLLLVMFKMSQMNILGTYRSVAALQNAIATPKNVFNLESFISVLRV